MLQDQSFDFRSLQSAYRAGTDPAAVVEEAYRRIAALGDPGIFLSLRNKDAALADANALADVPMETAPLWGLPFAIKDNIDAAGMTTTAACPAFAYEADADAFVVARLRAAGAILIGKTNLDQFATGLVGVRTPYAVPLNALDPEIVPGGSSSGSAVAVAQGLVSFSLGTDTAGSGRVPAALNGIVGLKPTLGALSNTGVVPACRTLDTLSVFALTVDDAFRAFAEAAVFDAADAYSKKMPAPHMGGPQPGYRLGVPSTESIRFLGDDAQARSFQDSLARLRSLGAEITEVDFTPFFDVAEMLYDGPWVAERHAVIETLLAEQPNAVHPVTRQITEVALKFSATDAFRAEYKLKDLTRRIEAVMAPLDLLCVPSIPRFFGLQDLAADPIGPNAALGTYTNFVNLLDMCAITVPVTQREDGRPGSVTLIALAGADGRIAAIAQALQQATGPALGATPWQLPAPVSENGTPAPDEIALVAVGAHMSGLPLNGDLTSLGARFLRQARTTDGYRLYKLAGGPPARPGLVRDRAGGAIDVELWALPAQAFGDFLRTVPAPLGIGTVQLDDGTSAHGFLCESIATEDAEEITHLGGWRAYLATLPNASQQDKEFDHATA